MKHQVRFSKQHSHLGSTTTNDSEQTTEDAVSPSAVICTFAIMHIYNNLSLTNKHLRHKPLHTQFPYIKYLQSISP